MFVAMAFGGVISFSGWLMIVASLVLALAVNLLAFLLPMRIGLKRLQQREI